MSDTAAETTMPTEESRQLARALARAMWFSTMKANGNAMEPGSDEMRASWDEEKGKMTRVANMTIRRLEAKGIQLVQK